MAAMVWMGKCHADIQKQCSHEHDFFHIDSLLIIGWMSVYQ